MKISSLKKLLVEEFPVDIRSWLTKMFQPLNTFMAQTNQALGGQLTVGDNVKGLVKTVDVVSNSASFLWTVNEHPNALLIGYVVGTDSPTPATISAAFSHTWTIDVNNKITVTFLGLDSSKRYRAKLIGIV